MLDLDNHPCFNPTARSHSGRVHLPVAPRCNIQCNFCNRDCDCVNESRPGVSSTLLSPHQALAYLERLLEQDTSIRVVGIAGPGDPFANAPETMETLRLVRAKYPEMLLCVATNGVDILPYIDELSSFNVSHVTVTINAVRPEIAARVYGWARDGKKVLRGVAAGEFIIERQMASVARLKAKGICVKINTIFLPGVNDDSIEEVAKATAALGADFMNIVPLYAVEGTPFAELSAPEPARVGEIRKACAQHLRQLAHCTRCRADAAGLLGQSLTGEALDLLRSCARLPLRLDTDRPYVAVGSMEGVLVNQHMGEAGALRIYAREDGRIRFVGVRETPEPGTGDARWQALADTLHDCRAVVVSGVGQNPHRILTASGVQVVEAEGIIENVVESVYDGEAVRFSPRPRRCGDGCAGNGQGCS